MAKAVKDQVAAIMDFLTDFEGVVSTWLVFERPSMRSMALQRSEISVEVLLSGIWRRCSGTKVFASELGAHFWLHHSDAHGGAVSKAC